MNKFAFAAAFGSALLAHAALAAATCPVRANAQAEAQWRSAVADYCQVSGVKAGQAGMQRARLIEDCLRRCQAQAKLSRSAHPGASPGPILAATGAAAGVTAAVAAAHLGEKPASP